MAILHGRGKVNVSRNKGCKPSWMPIMYQSINQSVIHSFVSNAGGRWEYYLKIITIITILSNNVRLDIFSGWGRQE